MGAINNLFEHYDSGKALYERVVAPVCEKHRLTYMEFTVLMFLANNPQYDTAAQVVKYRRLTKSHVSISVRSLQEKGLINCAYHEPDRRTIHLSIPDAAKDIICDGRLAQQRFQQVLHNGFSDDELAVLSALLRRIDQNIISYTQK